MQIKKTQVIFLVFSFLAFVGYGKDAKQLQDSFIKVANTAFPAVVVITNKRVEYTAMYPNLSPELRFFFGIPEPEQYQRRSSIPRPVGKGSGAIVDKNGYIITNYHVIRGADALEVRLQDGQIFDSAKEKNAVKIVGVDKETDIAVLQIGNGKIKNLPILKYADSSKVKIGQWCIAVGAPFSLDYSVTVGVVSQKGRHDVGMSTYENYIQTDASINPGNSGGPLLDINGNIIGVNNFILTGGGGKGSIGVGFAIASNLVKQVADSLIKTGRVSRPFLGVSMQELDKDLQKLFRVSKGVLISQVTLNSPAFQAGIKEGDVIVKIADKEIRTVHDLRFAVLAFKPDDYISVTVSRNGKNLDYKVKAVERVITEVGQRENQYIPEKNKRDIGLTVTDHRGHIIITNVERYEASAEAGLMRGDVILEINKHKVSNVKQLQKQLEKIKGNFIFYIQRGNAKRYFSISME